jgi:sirohydrochlorin ferrochelatase
LRPAVVLVAHGSRDPRAAVATEALARAVRLARPEWLVRASYLDHDGPRPLDVLGSAPSSRAVLVPLLLTSAYHGRVDMPAVVREAQSLPIEVSASEVLGPVSPLLVDALQRRLVEAVEGSGCAFLGAGPGFAACPAVGEGSVALAGSAVGGSVAGGSVIDGSAVDGPAVGGADLGGAALGGAALGGSAAGGSAARGAAVGGAGVGVSPVGSGLDGVVLASAGTRDEAARVTVADAAAALGRRLGLPAAVAYASGPGPRPDEAVALLRASGATRVGMAAYFLAPGFLYDLAAGSAREAGAVVTAGPLADAPELVRLVCARAESVLTGPLAAVAA